MAAIAIQEIRCLSSQAGLVSRSRRLLLRAVRAVNGSHVDATVQEHVPPASPEFAWPIAAAGLLALLSAYRLAARSLGGGDEIPSVVFASSPLPTLVHTLTATGEANMAVYYLLLRVWLSVGEDESWIRLLSLLIGVATILPIYMISRRIGGHVAGSLAAFVFALSSFVIRYNQEARGYSLAMLVAAILTWLLVRAIDRPTIARWAAYGLLAALGFYVHFFFVFVVAAHVLFVAASRSWPRGRALVAAGFPILLASIPIATVVVLQTGSHIAWIPPITLSSVANILSGVVGGQLLLVVMIELTGLALLIHGRQRLIWLVVAWLVVPPAAVVLISVWKPLLIDRFLAVSVPAVAVLAGVALAGIRPRGARNAGVVGLGLLLLISVPQAYQRPESENWRSAAQWIAATSGPGDRIAFQGLGCSTPSTSTCRGERAIQY